MFFRKLQRLVSNYHDKADSGDGPDDPFGPTRSEDDDAADPMSDATTPVLFHHEHVSHPTGYRVVQVDVDNVSHHGLHPIAQREKTGEVVQQNIREELQSLLTGTRNSELAHVHLHCDVAE